MSIQENGIGSASNPSPNHLAALARAERERKKDEATRMLLSSPPLGSDLAVLAELLKNPQAVSKRVADLTEATRKNEAAAALARRDTEALRQAEKNLAAAQKASADKIEHNEANHAMRLAAELASIEAEKAEIAKLKAAAESDAKKAAELKNEMTRRLKAMEGAV